MYTVTWHGMDGSFHEDEKGTLKEAQEWATYVEDHGHGVSRLKMKMGMR